MTTLLDFTLTPTWEMASECSVSNYLFEQTMNKLKETHHVKFLELSRNNDGTINYIIAKKDRNSF